MRVFFAVCFFACSVLGVGSAAWADPGTWPVREGDPGGARYSTLAEITPENIHRLEVAWVYHSGDATERSINETTPLMVDGALYLCTASGSVVCLDPGTGTERWRYFAYDRTDMPRYPGEGHGPQGLNRGIAWWSEGDASRIVLGTTDGWLLSLDAKTGIPDPAFGENGFVDLRSGIDRDLSKAFYGMTSPPAIFEDIIICGMSTSEDGMGEAPGDLRAFSIRDGEELWRFHTIPRPGEIGAESWADAGEGYWERGGANPWGGLSIDLKRGWVFAALGSVGPDYFGGDRPGDNLFANCVLALDARSGAYQWHFQTVRHDLWDLDLPSPPMLLTIPWEGEEREVAVQVSKTGWTYVLDRDTGESLYPLEERPVPASDVPGEHSASHQIYPTAPPAFARQEMSLDDITQRTPEAHAYVRERFEGLRPGKIFTPSGAEGTVFMPGLHGGATWAGASFDPASNLLYVASNDVPWIGRVHVDTKARVHLEKFLDNEGYPAITPPWGTLTAIDLSQGEIAWQSVLGEYPELKAQGLPPTGTENFGGNIVTEGGLVFVGGTMDSRFRAYDKKSGALLWSHELPASAYAQPSTYLHEGRQYVVTPASGGGKLQTATSDAVIAFALAPEVEPTTKKVVFIAGTKSHGPGDHEYEKGLRLLQQCLEASEQSAGFRTELHLNGWPDNPATLNDADTIILYSDGSDHNLLSHPAFRDKRLEVLRRQMDRGCGLIAIHYSTFAAVHFGGEEWLEWMGGYFDYERGPDGGWYSAIQTREYDVFPSDPHPIARGVEPFSIQEEYYFRMRFRDDDPRLVPVLSFDPELQDPEKVVAWAVERENGGRGFAFTGGHYHANWDRDEYKRLLLNAIAWTAGEEVPEQGITCTITTEESEALAARTVEKTQVLILTGYNGPFHDWRGVTLAIEEALAEDGQIEVSVWTDPERLASEELHRFDVLIQNYVNWDRPTLGEAARQNLLDFISNGGGFMLIHFANGAWRDWDEYRALSQRVWVDEVSGHDPFGPFLVEPTTKSHPITEGIEPFKVIDELYFAQVGDAEVEPLLTARSTVTGEDEPLAWLHQYGDGRIFQTLLGHAAESLRGPEMGEILRRAVHWCAKTDE